MARDAFVYGSNYLEDAVVLGCGDDEPVAELAAQVLERLAERVIAADGQRELTRGRKSWKIRP